MIIDTLTQFANATSIGTPNNATVNVGDVVDTLGSFTGNRDLGNGKALYLIIIVTSTFTSGGATLLSLILASDSTSTLSVDDTQSIHYESASEDDSAYTAGKVFVIPLPAGDLAVQVGAPGAYERYLGVQVRNRAAVAVTGGAITAFLSEDPTKWLAYADAVN